jgi:hypothetical protein
MVRVLYAGIALAVIMSTTPPASALTEDSEFVRTANYFLMSGKTLDQSLKTLSSFDLIVIPVEAQVYNKTFFKKIRGLNPDIVILPYIATVSWNDLYWNDSLHKKLFRGIQNRWWLKDGNNKQISVWPGTRALNLNSGWNDYLTTFVQNEVLSTGLWDGVFYDEVQDSISWVGAVDVNADSRADSAKFADEQWAISYEKLFRSTRELVGKEKIIITNGSSNPVFAQYVNGRMYETFPSSDNSIEAWEKNTRDYVSSETSVGYEPVHVINVNTENRGGKNDYQKIRFGITTTLLGNGFFAFDFGTQDHSQLWIYDEYSVNLGKPKSEPKSESEPAKKKISAGVWLREFEQGAIIVNATATPQKIKLKGEFEKLHGAQDPVVNNGSIVSEVQIASKDGIILLRPIETLENATFQNGSFARIFNSEGKTKRTGFFVYESSQRGGVRINISDIDSDGENEKIVANDTYVSIFDNGKLRAKFAPYTDNYKLGVNIALGDLENDGTIEIVTGTENGGGPQVRVFNIDGALINPGFFAYDKAFRGGVNVAVGDLNGDNVNEIITGAGVGGGPHVRVFKKDGALINPGFFAYDKAFRGGVNVAVGDVDSDGIDEIITGAGIGGAPTARIFDRNGNMESQFDIFDSTRRDGLDVTASDVDNDGTDEIIGLSTDVFTINGGRESAGGKQ